VLRAEVALQQGNFDAYLSATKEVYKQRELAEVQAFYDGLNIGVTKTEDNVHLSENGVWQNCTVAACPLPYHFTTELSADELNALPSSFFSDLGFESDNPTRTERGRLYWSKSSRKHSPPHRLYDLPAVIDEIDGYKAWYIDGGLHRDNDQPAMITKDDKKEEKGWYHHGRPHRENDQPAFIITQSDGYWKKEWYRQGKKHRENDQPAVINSAGDQEWWRNGMMERLGDKPAMITRYMDGTIGYSWFKLGQLHRTGDKPAVINPDGTQQWYRNGRRHRSYNRPAVIYPDGTEEYWVDGVVRLGH
jgi:hypothetical protein